MKYLTFDQAGNLTGAYIQDVPPEHADNHMEVSDADYANWVNLHLVNGALEPKPPAPPAPPAIPEEVPMASARIILLRAGITAAMVTNAINADGTMTDAQKAEALIDFEFRTSVRRRSPLTLALGPALGLTLTQMDTMFVQAGAL
jgi:hypothetical protein